MSAVASEPGDEVLGPWLVEREYRVVIGSIKDGIPGEARGEWRAAGTEKWLPLESAPDLGQAALDAEREKGRGEGLEQGVSICLEVAREAEDRLGQGHMAIGWIGEVSRLIEKLGEAP